MKSEKVDLAEVIEALGTLRQEVARLGERVAALEAAAGTPTPADVGQTGTSAEQARTADSKVCPTPRVEPLREELLLVISAAIAAYLGKKPYIRQIRLVGTTAWAQQGRVTIQASHALAPRHPRS
jgi:methylmalonyl-CoA carboxyltransferase large subunit